LQAESVFTLLKECQCHSNGAQLRVGKNRTMGHVAGPQGSHRGGESSIP